MNTPASYLQTYLNEVADSETRTFKLSVIVIIGIGFLLRLHSWHTGEAYHYFTINDEVAALKQAFALLAGEPQAFYLGQPAFAGGNAPGPLWTAFTAGLYLLGLKSIQGALLWMVIFNTALIYLVYRIARHFFDPRWTLLTTLLFATSPWTVYYSIGFYNPIVLGVLGALLLYSLWKVVNEPYSVHLFWALLITAAIPQFHMIGLFYVPALLLVLWLAPVRLSARWFVLGCAGGLLLYVPYLVGDALNQWQNTRDILSGAPREFSWSVLKIITAPATLISNALGRAPGDEFDNYLALGNQYFIHSGILLLLNSISLILALYIFLYGFYKYLRLMATRIAGRVRTLDARLMLAGSLIYVPLLLFLPTGHNYAGRYAIIIFAPLFLLPGLVIGQFNKQRWARLLGATLTLLALLNIYIVIALYNFKQQAVLAGEPFSPSFVRLAEISRAVSGQTIPEERYKIVYSKDIRQMPEGQYKLYRAAGDYLNLKLNGRSRPVQVLYFYARPGAAPADKTIVYASRNLVIAQ